MISKYFNLCGYECYASNCAGPYCSIILRNTLPIEEAEHAAHTIREYFPQATIIIEMVVKDCFAVKLSNIPTNKIKED